MQAQKVHFNIMKGTQDEGPPTEVGIRELRDHLAKYVDLVRDGEEVVITERGKPVAKIVRVYPPGLQTLMDEGLVRPGRRPRRKLPPPIKAKGSVSDLIERK